MLACSALKRSYRDELLAGRPAARMVFLHVTREVLEARLRARPGHFFPAALLDSQLADPGAPAARRGRRWCWTATTPPEQVVDEIIQRLQLRPPQEKMSP